MKIGQTVALERATPLEEAGRDHEGKTSGIHYQTCTCTSSISSFDTFTTFADSQNLRAKRESICETGTRENATDALRSPGTDVKHVKVPFIVSRGRERTFCISLTFRTA